MLVLREFLRRAAHALEEVTSEGRGKQRLSSKKVQCQSMRGGRCFCLSLKSSQGNYISIREKA